MCRRQGPVPPFSIIKRLALPPRYPFAEPSAAPGLWATFANPLSTMLFLRLMQISVVLHSAAFASDTPRYPTIPTDTPPESRAIPLWNAARVLPDVALYKYRSLSRAPGSLKTGRYTSTVRCEELPDPSRRGAIQVPLARHVPPAPLPSYDWLSGLGLYRYRVSMCVVVRLRARRCVGV